ncbi:MAG: hypothetical protein KDK07_16725 [Bauldia sp.]|nr:hypothetical protein [Bauldia sp.]
MKSRRIAFWVLLVVTAAVYALMVGWTLPLIEAQAGGLRPFDLQPIGYDYAEARAFLAALTPEGADVYLRVQHTLDSIYPALLAATLFFAIGMLAPKALGIWRWMIALIAIPGAVFDYLENAAVSAMIAAGPDGISDDQIATASLWTVLKSAFTTIAIVVLLALLVVWVVQRRWLASATQA